MFIVQAVGNTVDINSQKIECSGRCAVNQSDHKLISREMSTENVGDTAEQNDQPASVSQEITATGAAAAI